MGQAAAVAWHYFELLNERRHEEAQDLLNDGGTWWSIGTRTRVPMTQQKKAFAATMGMLSMHFTLIDWIESGDKVVLELEGSSDVPGGGRYDQVYSATITVWEGTLLHVREYADTNAADSLPKELLDQFRAAK